MSRTAKSGEMCQKRQLNLGLHGALNAAGWFTVNEINRMNFLNCL